MSKQQYNDLDNLGNLCGCCNKTPELIIIDKRKRKMHGKYQKAYDTACAEADKGTMATQYAAVIFNEKTGVVYSKGHNRLKGVQTDKARQCVLHRKQTHDTCRTRFYFQMSQKQT